MRPHELAAIFVRHCRCFGGWKLKKSFDRLARNGNAAKLSVDPHLHQGEIAAGPDRIIFHRRTLAVRRCAANSGQSLGLARLRIGFSPRVLSMLPAMRSPAQIAAPISRIAPMSCSASTMPHLLIQD